METLDINNDREVLMALLAVNGVTAEEYAVFLSKHEIPDLRRIMESGDEDDDIDPEYDYIPMTDADRKTLKLKIQMRDVSKPPMWREVLVPADFNFSQLHYVIQAAVGLDNDHLWQFERKPYDNCGLAIGIPRSDPFSYGIEDCTFHADQTPLTAFLARKGDKLVYVYDFRLDWIFNITVLDVLDRQGEVAECRKYKSDLQALDGYSGFSYTLFRDFLTNRDKIDEEELGGIMEEFDMDDPDRLEAFLDDNLIDIEYVNEVLAEIPDKWEPID